MKKRRMGSGLARAGVLGVAAYALVVRPRSLRWGATEAETGEALPGDELVAAPDYQTTRAITIVAPPERVWPWIVQLGYGRGGFYSYDALERAAGLAGLESAGRIVPEWQGLQVGDVVRIAPETPMTVRRLEPGRALVLQAVMNPFTARIVEPGAGGPAMDWSWAFVLTPLEPVACRLVVRVRAELHLPGAARDLLRLALEPAHFIMERKMLQGIKARAEEFSTNLG